MKKIGFFLTLLAVILVSISCENNDNQQQNNTIVAKYSGVLVGSSGSYKLRFSETNSNATIIFDDKTYVLNSNETLQKGETLTLTDGTVTLKISIDINGKNPNIEFNIPGHNVTATIAEETSQNLVENYTGQATVVKNEVLNFKSTFNVTLSDGNKFQAISKIIVNGGVDEGKVDQYNGTYVKLNGIVLISYNHNGETITIALNEFNNKLVGSQTDPETGLTTVELVKM